MRTLFSRRIRRSLFSIVGLGIIWATLFSGAPPAQAVAEFRQQMPVQAGTQASFPDGRCTVGAVLRSTRLLSYLPQGRATRYLVMSEHCAHNGDPVTVMNHGVIGHVIWTSHRSDLEIVQVDPLVRRQVSCNASSILHNCGINAYYTPRAIGNIFLRNHTGAYVSVPIAGTGTPGVNEIFCTSGAKTGVNCTWGISALPPDAPANLLGARTWAGNVVSGDSGGPVSSRAGRLYGIISAGAGAETSMPDAMSYVPISKVFEEQFNYEIAPAG